MKRRDFFKVITGFAAGIFATSVKGSKCSGTRLATEEEINDLKTYLREHYIYWGSDSNNIESYLHLIDGEYVMIPSKAGWINIRTCLDEAQDGAVGQFEKEWEKRREKIIIDSLT